MSRMEGFFEAISRIPGLGFLEKYAKDIRTARYTVRSGRERAEELGERANLVKESAGMKGHKEGKGKGKAGAGTGASSSPAAARDLRARSRRASGGDDFDQPATPKPSRKPKLDTDSSRQIRDNSPARDHGRSLRKRKEDF